MCRMLTAVEAVPDVDLVDREDATSFLLAQAAVLDPVQLEAAGRQLVETFASRLPSVDDPAEVEAVARAERAAERAAQIDEQNSLQVRTRPDGSITGRFHLAPESVAVLNAWLRQADTRHPGEGEFADDRQSDVRRGDHLVATLAHACRTGVEHTRPVHAKVVVTMPLEALQRGLAGSSHPPASTRNADPGSTTGSASPTPPDACGPETPEQWCSPQLTNSGACGRSGAARRPACWRTSTTRRTTRTAGGRR